MGDIVKKSASELLTEQQRCPYCGAVLNHAFYFCLSCATPYKSVSNVITAYIPPPLTEGELIEQKVPQVWTVFWTYAIVVFICFLMSVIVDEDAESWYSVHLVLSGILFTAVTLFFAFWHKTALQVQLKRFGFNHRYAWVGLILLIPALLLNYGFHSLVRYLLEMEDCYRSQAISELLNPTGLILIMCVLPAITEEIAFRGLIQHWLSTALAPWRAILLSAALFAALHLNLISFFYLFGLGVLLGWVRYKTWSLYPSMIIHFLHNLIVVLYFWPHQS